MAKIISYQIVSQKSEEMLAEHVNKWLKNGWELYGDVRICDDWELQGHQYLQSMVYYGEDTRSRMNGNLSYTEIQHHPYVKHLEEQNSDLKKEQLKEVHLVHSIQYPFNTAIAFANKERAIESLERLNNSAPSAFELRTYFIHHN